MPYLLLQGLWAVEKVVVVVVVLRNPCGNNFSWKTFQSFTENFPNFYNRLEASCARAGVKALVVGEPFTIPESSSALRQDKETWKHTIDSFKANIASSRRNVVYWTIRKGWFFNEEHDYWW